MMKRLRQRQRQQRSIFAMLSNHSKTGLLKKEVEFIKNEGFVKAKRILKRAPDDATHYRDLSCGTRYTKNISKTECYVWTDNRWRRSVVPYQIFTSEVIKPLSDLKSLVESLDRVNEHGGYLATKELLSFLIVHQGAFGKEAVSDETIKSLKVSIADHESVYGGMDA
ncbi:hypothetical protein ACTZ9G_001799 [Acinetobacter baumannii]|uniref:Uncharacterized protein n=2 Tax=Acinetobacter baumannii TaxID=470 RepID=A0A836LXR0_ACIBA|nr:hypothetical protein [Acinetobacter baumannii]EIW4106132.1 hypothetical protein [Acinetobacter baumannii]EKT9211672.1 hypothetical protein [Acinetobacter baumannii]EKT9384771.1 hypothetical protein [Acinetobacter baumannii]EKT9861574.1 hypothetical protein [Acinetobacter baumannii]EKT9906566.1 hypothetical protein [Acinetobacter baumannii]